MNKTILNLKQGVIEGNAEYVKKITETAVKEGMNADEIITLALMPVMDQIGLSFKKGELYIPDVLMSSRAMHASLYVLKPLMTQQEHHKKGRIVIGTVAGDLHDIGKNMVTWSLQGEGYEVIDLGIDVPASEFIKAIRNYQPDILALSALLTTTLGEIRTVIRALIDEGLRRQVKIVIGGGPVTRDYSDEVMADGYGEDIFEAIDVVNALLGKASGYFSERKGVK